MELRRLIAEKDSKCLSEEEEAELLLLLEEEKDKTKTPILSNSSCVWLRVRTKLKATL